MKRAEKTLVELFHEHLAKRSLNGQVSREGFDRENQRHISRLAARGVATVAVLIEALPELPPKLKDFGIWWLTVKKSRKAETVLLRMLHDDPSVRLSCASALTAIGGRRSEREFLRIGKDELASSAPGQKWLEAVIRGLKLAHCPEAEELLLIIYERTDLPGWLRGDAGDGLGCSSLVQDRRTTFFRRAWVTALNGLNDDDIEVKFWSMYVLMQLAQNHSHQSGRSNERFAPALPKLREIAATDHRLAPGYWWSMSAEAEDAIHVIEHGTLAEPDAAER